MQRPPQFYSFILSRLLILSALFMFICIVRISSCINEQNISPVFSADITLNSTDNYNLLSDSASNIDAQIIVRMLYDGEIIPIRMDEYLERAVFAEMPSDFSPAALEAQAIAIRTLICYNKLYSNHHPDMDADICTDPSCCLGWKDSQNIPENILSAVRSTDGILAVYDGEPILAAFSSCCSGKRTKSSEEVWGNFVPYLCSVYTPETGQDNTGHGVGMSQRGANILALDGYTADEIISHYYTDVHCERMHIK